MQNAEERYLRAIAAIKRAAALCLLAAFFLPLSQCTVAERNLETRAIDRTVIVTYAYSGENPPSLDALAGYAAFLWPLAFAIAGLIWPSVSGKWAIGVIEILLCAGSAFMLYAITYGEELRYGAYVAMGAISAYFIAALVQLFLSVSRHGAVSVLRAGAVFRAKSRRDV